MSLEKLKSEITKLGIEASILLGYKTSDKRLIDRDTLLQVKHSDKCLFVICESNMPNEIELEKLKIVVEELLPMGIKVQVLSRYMFDLLVGGYKCHTKDLQLRI